MTAATPEKLPLSGLLGLAFDVSASMRESIENNDAQQTTGVSALQDLVARLRTRGLTALDAAYPSGMSTSTDVFAYAFGLRVPDDGSGAALVRSVIDVFKAIFAFGGGNASPETFPVVCDLLSVLATVQGCDDEAPAAAATADSDQSASFPSPESAAPALAREPEATDWDNELAQIANRQGRGGWELLARELLPEPEQIKRLVLRLRAEPWLAEELAQLVPRASQGEINLAVQSVRDSRQGKHLGTAYVEHPLVTARMAHSNRGELMSVRSNLRQARTLLERLATPPDPDVSPAQTLQEIRRTVAATVLEAADAIDTTLPVEEVLTRLRRLDASNHRGVGIEEFVYGSTPMRQAMERIASRFEAELANRPAKAPATFVLVSDGQSTDGNPSQALASISAQGVTIIACHLTDQDLTHPRTLHSAPGADWTHGATVMFNAASPLSLDQPFAARLCAAGWHIEEGARWFIQINHSTVISDFLETLLSISEH
ncbi:VWA domain-containing protein [Streptomyces sp. NBC_01296]|uniref:VWA domain-containing protein n=1 Tax=Streptomyces sp. NBC_01296 TaxID=2903816 RepID=UPI002E159EBE|nr:VWA domain-containing protein [Streptomyces sp. NBC_01296]